MPEKVQFDSPWNVATIEATLNDVEAAKGTEDTLEDKIGAIETAISNVTPTAYTAPQVPTAYASEITIESGGFCKAGNLVCVAMRVLTGNNAITSSAGQIIGLFEGLPYAIKAAGLDSGSSVAFVANSLGLKLTITDQGRILMLASQTIPANSRFYLNCTYLAQTVSS